MLIFDTLLRGGTIIDPGVGLNIKADLGIIRPNIAQIVKPGETIYFRDCIDVTGCIITPGFIDFHTHIFQGGMEIGFDPNFLTRQGTVATVDAGSIGYPSFSYFRQTVMANSTVYSNALINASRVGLLMLDQSEFSQPGFFEESELAKTIQVHKDVVLGIKLRFTTGHIADDGLQILKKAQKLARDLDVKVFVHSTNPPVPYPKLLDSLHAGDVLIHMYHGRGSTLVDLEGKVWKEAWEAKKRGVIFDCAHGMSHFNFNIAKKAIEQGFLPDIISSDMTSHAFTISNFCELPTVMSQFLSLGLKFEDILLGVTHKPAELMKGVTTGIKVGNPANLVVLKIEERDIEFTDSEGNKMKGEKLIVPQITFINGQIVHKL